MIADGDFTMLLADDERVYAYVRALDGVELLVLGNFSGDEVVIDLPGWEDAEAAHRVAGAGSRAVGGEGVPALSGRRIW